MATKEKGWIWAIVKIGATVIAASALGAWATRRTSWSPMMRGAVRGVSAGVAAWFARKKAPNLALGLGVYALATAAEGGVEQYDMSRYLGMADSERQALGAGSTSGATTQGGTQPQPATIPAGSGYGAAYGDAIESYQRAGYPVI